MDYLSHIRDALVQPLTSQGVEGVQDVVALMDTYYLMKEDFENIMEISSWGGKPSPFSKLDPKVIYAAHCSCHLLLVFRVGSLYISLVGLELAL
jgi:hypothetical protein